MYDVESGVLGLIDLDDVDFEFLVLIDDDQKISPNFDVVEVDFLDVLYEDEISFFDFEDAKMDVPADEKEFSALDSHYFEVAAEAQELVAFGVACG